MRKVYDLMDEYEDEATEEDPKDAFALFKMLQDELLRNGFLSRIRRETAEEAQEMDAARVPTDHQK